MATGWVNPGNIIYYNTTDEWYTSSSTTTSNGTIQSISIDPGFIDAPEQSTPKSVGRYLLKSLIK